MCGSSVAGEILQDRDTSANLEQVIESDQSYNILLNSPWSFDQLPSTYVAEYIYQDINTIFQ